MSVYGRGTKNGQYIRGRNSYDSYRGESCSNKVDDPFSHSFDFMIENAKNQVIEQDKRKKRLEEQNEQLENNDKKNNIEIDNSNIEIKEINYTNHIDIKKSIFISSIISILSICNLWILINNFDPNSLFIILSFMFNFLFFMFFVSKYLSDLTFKNNDYYKYITKKTFIIEVFSLISIVLNTYYIISY